MNEESKPNPTWASDYFRDEGPPEQPPLGRGMIGQVRIVAALMFIQGVMELILGITMLFSGALMLTFNRGEFQGLGIISLVISVLCFCGAGLHLWAGMVNWNFRRRKLGITALGLGLISVLTFYCALTGIPLAVYGLIVLLNDSVIAAFEMGDRGRSYAEIDAAFPVEQR